jgi:hypothetical protein
MIMGVVKIVITDEMDEDCAILINYEGKISDQLKDLLSSPELATYICNGLSAKDFFVKDCQ